MRRFAGLRAVFFFVALRLAGRRVAFLAVRRFAAFLFAGRFLVARFLVALRLAGRRVVFLAVRRFAAFLVVARFLVLRAAFFAVRRTGRFLVAFFFAGRFLVAFFLVAFFLVTRFLVAFRAVFFAGFAADGAGAGVGVGVGVAGDDGSHGRGGGGELGTDGPPPSGGLGGQVDDMCVAPSIQRGALEHE